MTKTGCFLSGLAICSFVVLSIITIIHRRFLFMMVDLCEGEERASFWTLAVEAWFALYSISSALEWYPEGTSDRQLFLAGVAQVKNGLTGTSIAIVLFSTGIILFVVLRKLRGSERDILGRKSA
jgi:hypothetical protein